MTTWGTTNGDQNWTLLTLAISGARRTTYCLARWRQRRWAPPVGCAACFLIDPLALSAAPRSCTGRRDGWAVPCARGLPRSITVTGTVTFILRYSLRRRLWILRLPETSPSPIGETPQPSTTQASRLLHPWPEGPWPAESETGLTRKMP